MWTILKSPLIIGANIPAVDAAALGVLTNTAAISVNQDPLGVQVRCEFLVVWHVVPEYASLRVPSRTTLQSWHAVFSVGIGVWCLEV
jgi:hypothetical protein